KSGQSGFTGYDGAARCDAFGVEHGCGEVIAPEARSLLAAMQAWLRTSGHGAPFLAYARGGCGVSSAAAVCDFVHDHAAPRYDLAASPNTATSSIRVCSPNGAVDVPRGSGAGEVPDPLAGYRGNHTDIGPALFISAAEEVRVRLRGPSGPIPLYYPFW